MSASTAGLVASIAATALLLGASDPEAPRAFGPLVEVEVEDRVYSHRGALDVDDSGTLHLVYSATVDGYYGYPVHVWSVDRGVTWSGARAVVDTSELRRVEQVRSVLVDGGLGVMWRRPRLPESHPLPRGLYYSAAAHGGDFTRRSVVVAERDVRLVDVVETSIGHLACYFVRWRETDGRYDHVVSLSTDGGESWTAADPIDAANPSRRHVPFGGVAAGPGGRLYVAYVHEDRWLHCHRSDDATTWEGFPIFSGVHTHGASVAVRDDGVVAVAWAQSFDGPPSNAYFSVSFDGGETWSSPMQISTQGPQGNYYHPLLAVAGDTWHVAMLWNVPHSSFVDLYYAASGDDGATWSAPVLLSDSLNTGPYHLNVVGFSHSLAVDDSGEVYVSFSRHLRTGGEQVVLRTTAEPLPPNVLAPDDRVLARAIASPSRGRSTLLFQIPDTGPVEVTLTDAAGRLVDRWTYGALTRGEHRIEWAGEDAPGEPAGSGVYFWHVAFRGESGTETASAKSILVR